MGTRKKQTRRRHPSVRVTLEIARSELSLVIIDERGQVPHVRGHHRVWLNAASSLDSQEGVQELTNALAEIVGSERLAGAAVNVSLSSDFCVTRVLAGETDRVRAELRHLRDRSHQYLLLGAGEKAVAESSRSIDAKNTQAWLTVTNKGVLDHVVNSITDAGLQVELVEHDMVAICRAVGKMGLDTHCPVIVVELNAHGVDLGVSYGGQLLFDYRPGGVDCKERIGEIVDLHLERIQRYCRRHFRFATGDLQTVIICGRPEEASEIQTQFAHSTKQLTAQVLDPRQICPRWHYDEQFGQRASFCAAIGSALVDRETLALPAEQRNLCDLMDYFRSGEREPLWPAVARVCWPIAATLLLAVGVYGAAAMKGRAATARETEAASFAPQLAAVAHAKNELTQSTAKLKHLRAIGRSVLNPRWHHLVLVLGASKPQDLWLDSVRVDDEGLVEIKGPSRSEDLIFEFVGQLKKMPQLAEVSLEGQSPGVTRLGPVIHFDIKCRFSDRTAFAERTVKND